MPRKKVNRKLQDKIDTYLDTYELDDMNEANDMVALVQMCQFELNIEQIQTALSSIKNPLEDSKKIKELQGALRDANQNWVTLQTELGINRKKRKSEDDETPLKYIERLQEQAKKIIDSRYRILKCENCGQVLGKFIVYVQNKGEEGSIDSKTKVIEDYKYTFRCECWKCGKVSGITSEGIVLSK